MQSAILASWWPWILGLTLLSLLGVALSLLGLFPRRSGTTPHCRRCGYNLTGLDRDAADARCSECGSAVTIANAIVLGERVRRWRRVSAGLVLFVLGVAPLVTIVVGSVRKVDWYAYKPTGWVLADVRSDNRTIASRALQEMNARLAADALSPEQIIELIGLCLDAREHWRDKPAVTPAWAMAGGGVTPKDPSWRITDLLDRLYNRDLLSHEQTDRYFAEMIRFFPRIRPRVTKGEPFYAGVRINDRGPSSEYCRRIKLGEIRVDGEPYATTNYSSRGPAGTSDRDFGGICPALEEPGEYVVSIDVGFQILLTDEDEDWNQNWVAEDEALWTDRRTVSAAVNVLEQQPEDLIRMVHSPELDQAVAACVALRDFRVVKGHSTSGTSPTRLHGSVAYHSPPVPLAFDILAEFGDERVLLSRTCRSIEDFTHWFSGGFDLPVASELPEQVTIILRSSRKAAQRTPDLYEIWDGELRFENMKVPAAATDSAPVSVSGRYWPSVCRRDPRDDERTRISTMFADHWAPRFRRSTQTFGDDDWRERFATMSSESRTRIDSIADEHIEKILREALGSGVHLNTWEDPGFNEPTEIDPLKLMQSARFKEMVEFELLVRPVVVKGQEFFVGITCRDHGPRGAFQLRLRLREIRFSNGQRLRLDDTLSARTGYSGTHRLGREFGTHTTLSQAGTWQIEADVEFQLDEPDSPSFWTSNSSALYAEKRTIRGEVEVLDEEPPDLFRLTHSPVLDREIAKRVRLSEFSCSTGPLGFPERSRSSLEGMVWFDQPLPLGLAFDASAEYDGRTAASSRPVIARATTSDSLFDGIGGIGLYFPVTGNVPDRITVILRGSKAEAARTPYLYEIWDGELRFENVKVHADDSTPSFHDDGRYVPVVTPRDPP